MFFAMRSCEYLHVPASETRRTKVLTLHNLRFFQHGKELPHNHSQLHAADTITITFVFQKSDERNEDVTMHCTTDPSLCPVKVYAALVRRIRIHPKANDSSPIHLFTDGEGNLQPITSAHIRLTLRAAATLIGEDRIGFNIKDIGTHSIRSGAAMAMYLDDVPVYTIMIVGKWSSDAFLRYIRRQVKQFSHNVSSRMIKNQHFYHIPTFEPSSHRLDPLTPNDPNNFASRVNSGGGSRSSRVMSSPFALWT